MTFLNPSHALRRPRGGHSTRFHFFYRARYRPLPWGAMKFLRLSIEQTSRRLALSRVGSSIPPRSGLSNSCSRSGPARFEGPYSQRRQRR